MKPSHTFPIEALPLHALAENIALRGAKAVLDTCLSREEEAQALKLASTSLAYGGDDDGDFEDFVDRLDASLNPPGYGPDYGPDWRTSHHAERSTYGMGASHV